MSEPFLSEIKIVSFNFAPRGWALCNGQILPINQNQALFSLLGTTYGGNGQTNFALPNMQGRAALHWGAGFDLGQASGETAHTVTMQEMAAHTHFLQGTSNSTNDSVNPGDNLPATLGSTIYGQATNLVSCNPGSIPAVGGSQPHTNMMPTLVLNFIIALQGIFPSRN